VAVEGLFMYKNNTSVYESVKCFVNEFVKKNNDFNECYGAFRISIKREDKKQEIYFADNSGMMRFYINTNNNKVFGSLLEAVPTEKRRPNYPAIAQFISYGCIYGNETIDETIVLSDPNCFYQCNEDNIVEKTKQLEPLSKPHNSDMSLQSLVSKAVMHCPDKIGCTITGGVDSRTVLANLVSIGVKPELAITGNELQSDVKIAKIIADKLKLNLSIISDDIDEDDWLENTISAADGQAGICSIYRLDKLARFLNNKEIILQFGGLAGEMYKNSFINQDFPFYFGRPRWKRFYKYKVGTFDIDRSLFAKETMQEIDRLPSTITKWLENHKGQTKSEAYLNAGYEIMQARCHQIINMFENHATIYNPLMERRMAQYAFGKNPYLLDMQAFQRHEVSSRCDTIKSVETDRGLTCDYKRRKTEFIKSNLFLIKVALNRMAFRKKIDIRIDRCFETGHKGQDFIKALAVTQKMGILCNDIDFETIPSGIADRLFTLGLFFLNSEYKIR